MFVFTSFSKSDSGDISKNLKPSVSVTAVLINLGNAPISNILLSLLGAKPCVVKSTQVRTEFCLLDLQDSESTKNLLRLELYVNCMNCHV